MRKCDQCEYKANSKEIIRHHKLSMHEGKINNECGKCDKRFATQAHLKRHQAFKHDGQRMKCNLCEFKAKDKTTINQHRMSKHEGKMIKCDQCEKQFSFIGGKDHLARHISINHDNVRFLCSRATCVISDIKIRVKQKSTNRPNTMVSNILVTNVTMKVKF